MLFTDEERLKEDSPGIDINIYNLSKNSRLVAERDVKKFINMVGDEVYDLDPVRVGHNIWYTRNGHGVGFWDTMEFEKEIGEKMTKACKDLGEVDSYVGDDGQIYLSNEHEI